MGIKNMETKYKTVPFDIERAKRITNGEEPGKIITRDKRDVRIVCWDAKNEFPIVALISNENREGCEIFTSNGLYVSSEQSHLDLFLSVPVTEQTTYKDGDVLIDEMNRPFIYNGKRNKEKGFFGCYCAIHIDVGLVFEKDGNDNWTGCIKGYAGKEDRQKLITKLNESDNPLAKEYLERFFGADEISNLSSSEKIGKDYKFEPGQPVIGVDGGGEWRYDLFSHYNSDRQNGCYVCSGRSYSKCLPYNEQTKYLIGTRCKLEE